MTPAIVQRLIEMINEGKTWIVAEHEPSQVPYLSLVDGKSVVTYSQAIILKVYIAQDGYKKRQKWIVPVAVLEKAARKIKAKDMAFWNRLTTCQMTALDIERLFSDATFGVVKLKLEE